MLCITVIAAGGCRSKPRIAPLRADSVIAAFGDSITEGAGASPDESYPVVLERLTGCKVVNCGVSGELSDEGAKRIGSVMERYHPNLVIICHGGNDLIRKEPYSQIEENLSGIVRTAKAMGGDVILVGVPQPSILLKAPKLYKRIAGKNNIPYEGRILHQILGDSSLKSDYIHPNAKGYSKLAEAILKLIRLSEIK